MSQIPVAVDGHDDLRLAAQETFAGLEVQVMEYNGKVGVALPYGHNLVFVVRDDDQQWYPTHGPLFEPCANQPVHDAESFRQHMVDWTAGV